MLPGLAPNENGLVPNTGCVEAVAEDELKGKRELEDAAPLDDPKGIGAPFVAAEAVAPNGDGELLVAALGAEDAPNENPLDSEPLVALGAEDVVNEKPVDGELLVAALGAVDPPKENPVDGEELKLSAGDFGGCQVEPNKLDVPLLLELTKLASDEEEPKPAVVSEPNGLEF